MNIEYQYGHEYKVKRVVCPMFPGVLAADDGVKTTSNGLVLQSALMLEQRKTDMGGRYLLLFFSSSSCLLFLPSLPLPQDQVQGLPLEEG